jgi:hypothetical protein
MRPIQENPMSATPLPAPRPAWREPLVWLVFGIPGLTIVAGFVTWWIAAQRADSNVVEDYYKQGLAINRSLERESHARTRGLVADVSLHGTNDLRVRLSGAGEMPSSITVLMVHPVRAEQDRRLRLDRQPDGSYRTVSPLVGPGTWSLAVETPDWRLADRRVVLREDGRLQLRADGRVD